MTVSIRKISLGSGYRYLMSSVARGDVQGLASSPLTRYYAESGTPPGRFLGAGLAGLTDGHGVKPGATVTEEHLFRMLGMLQDPVTGAQLGRPPRATGTTYIDRAGRARKPSRPVAGFDLTFSAPKSVSVAWALGDRATQAAVYRAHLRAVEYVVGYAERAGVFSSRSGDGGLVQEDVRGVVAAGFDHWDSRAGDPQLHTHVVVMNRVQCRDGQWRTLDGRHLLDSRRALLRGELPQSILPGTNTTIGVIATDAVITKVQAQRLAVAAHDGLARSINPVHTQLDGDTLFTLGTGVAGKNPGMLVLAAMATEATARATLRAVQAARSLTTHEGLFLPCMADLD